MLFGRPSLLCCLGVVLLTLFINNAFANLPDSESDSQARRVPVTRSADVESGRLLHFASILQAGVGLRYVNNSGICETTPGVHTMSGYIDVGTNMSMWFWFFEARNSPQTAPFTLWLNGGPGCSSMIGLFQEHGPCTIDPGGRSTSINPYSWNAISNMIYIDQPVPTGFSYGADIVNSTHGAAAYVWTAFQVLFESPEFNTYKSRQFILATESYGGHYGPEFVTYFNQQNAAIASGGLQGERVVVSALMINNGWIDPLIQNEAYINFTIDAPGYGPLQTQAVIDRMRAIWEAPMGCRERSQACYDAGNSSVSDRICLMADDTCAALAVLSWGRTRDPYDLRASDESFPSSDYLIYLRTASVLQAIGAESRYVECYNGEDFGVTGDGARTLLPQLGALADSRLKLLVWAGDTDIICNWIGNYEAVQAMDWYGRTRLLNTPLANITLDGKAIAAVQNVDNFSFVRVFEAGHEVPAYQPGASLEIFRQVIRGEQIHSANTTSLAPSPSASLSATATPGRANRTPALHVPFQLVVCSVTLSIALLGLT